MRRRPRGMTLIEVLVFAVTMLLLSGVMLYLVAFSTVTFQATTARSGPVQDVRTCLRRMKTDLSRTEPSSVATATGAFSLLSAEDSSGSFVTDGSGRPVWQKQVVYYVDSAGTGVRRKEVYGEFSEALSAAELAAQRDGSGTMLGAAVTGLAVTVSGRAATVALEASGATGHGTTDALSTSETLYLRN